MCQSSHSRIDNIEIQILEYERKLVQNGTFYWIDESRVGKVVVCEGKGRRVFRLFMFNILSYKATRNGNKYSSSSIKFVHFGRSPVVDQNETNLILRYMPSLKAIEARLKKNLNASEWCGCNIQVLIHISRKKGKISDSVLWHKTTNDIANKKKRKWQHKDVIKNFYHTTVADWQSAGGQLDNAISAWE